MCSQSIQCAASQQPGHGAHSLATISLVASVSTLTRLTLLPQVCGDIHGQFHDLLKLLKPGGEASHLQFSCCNTGARTPALRCSCFCQKPCSQSITITDVSVAVVNDDNVANAVLCIGKKVAAEQLIV